MIQILERLVILVLSSYLLGLITAVHWVAHCERDAERTGAFYETDDQGRRRPIELVKMRRLWLWPLYAWRWVTSR